MNIFENIKNNLDLKQTALRYGIDINRAGYTCCLFHNDQHPSMKLYSDHFHCFSCQEHGDVVKLIAQKLNVSQYECAKILVGDYHLSTEDYQTQKPPAPRQTFSQYESESYHIIKEYLDYLKYFNKKQTPLNESSKESVYFLKSVNEISKIEYYLDELIYKPKDERLEFLETHVNEINEIERDIEKFKRNGFFLNR